MGIGFMNPWFFLLPLIVVFVCFIVILVVYIFFNPEKKKMQELAGQVNRKGEGVLSVDGKEVILKYTPGSRNRSPELKMSVSGSFGAQMVIRRETSNDTFYMKIGLNKEAPISDQEITDKFYFECDIPEFVNQFLSNPDAKPLISDILAEFDFIEITKNSCTFRKYPSLSLESLSKDRVEDVRKQMTDAGRKLLNLINFIPQTVVDPHPELAFFKTWRAALYFIGTVVLTSGVVFLIWADVSFRVVDDLKAWYLSVMWFTAIFAAVGYLAFLAIKGHSTSAKVFIYFLVCFGIGLLLCIRYGGAVYNGFFDQSVVRVFDQVVTDKYTTTHKSSVYYHIVVAPWHSGMNNWSFTTVQGTYAYVRPGTTHCRIQTKSGCLGFEWVVYESLMI